MARSRGSVSSHHNPFPHHKYASVVGKISVFLRGKVLDNSFLATPLLLILDLEQRQERKGTTTSSKTIQLCKSGGEKRYDGKVESTVLVKSPAEGKELVLKHPLSDQRDNNFSKESAEVFLNNLLLKS